MENDTYFVKYSTQLSANPLKVSNWELLLNHLIATYATPLDKTVNASTISLISATYKSMLVHFPYLENYHIDYALFHFRLGGIKQARQIFLNALNTQNNRSLLIWCEYLKFLMKIEANKKTVLKNFEKAEFHVGMHFFASPFWDLYLQFILQNGYSREIYLRVLRKIIEIPQYEFAKYYTQWFEAIENEIKDIKELQKFVNLQSINKKYNINLHDIMNSNIRKGHLLQDLRLKLLSCFKELYQAIEYQVFEMYQLFELPLTMYKKTNQCYYIPSNIPLSSKFLTNWLRYLDFTIKSHNNQLILIVFQRCLNSANIAHLDTIWLKFADWLIQNNSSNGQSDYLGALDVLKQSQKFLRSPISNLKIVCKMSDLYLKLNYSSQSLVELWHAHYGDAASHPDYRIFIKYYSYMRFVKQPVSEIRIQQRLKEFAEMNFLECLGDKNYMEYIIKLKLKKLLRLGKFWYLYLHLIWNTEKSTETKTKSHTEKSKIIGSLLPVVMENLKKYNRKNQLTKIKNYRVVEFWLSKYSPEHLFLFKSLC
ncbi:hypothetical protein ACO0RG_002689 [Hanseniaspora osmophila]